MYVFDVAVWFLLQLLKPYKKPISTRTRVMPHIKHSYVLYSMTQQPVYRKLQLKFLEKKSRKLLFIGLIFYYKRTHKLQMVFI